jgi:glycosyltransferase involved in cell wall biosynthesis
MNEESPMVSIIMATYNRAHTIERAIDSVLNQTYKNFELIIVDDGSTDNTTSILMKYDDPRIRVFKHEQNKGELSAKNTGLKQIKGEWFTTFDSDDEMLPKAIETMINIPLYFDQKITAVTCNCWEPISNTFLGRGLNEDGYIKGNEVMPLCEGDFWGLTKTSLLMGEGFNVNLLGIVSSLWYKVNERANGYYIHQALNIVHIEGNDRLTTLNDFKFNFDRQILHYENLINEDLYLQLTKKYKPEEFYRLCRAGLFMMRISKNKKLASKYFELLKSFKKGFFSDFIVRHELPGIIYKTYFKFMPRIKREIGKFR